MPAKSEQQRKLIFAKRGQYGSVEKTPKKWKWVWEDGWGNKGKLPYKVKKKNKNKKFESNIITFSDFMLNEEKMDSYMCSDCGYNGKEPRFLSVFKDKSRRCPKCGSEKVTIK